MPDFSIRSSESEILDDPSLDGEELYKNLDEIAWINRFLGGNKTVLSGIQELLVKGNTGKVRIADIGCGSGDLPRYIVDWCRRKKIEVEIVAIDINPSIIAYAEKKSKSYPEIRYSCTDVFSEKEEASQYDIVIASLFLHHFSDTDIQKLIPLMLRKSRLGVLVNDLHRSSLAYSLFNLLTFALFASRITRHDGKVSILRAFTRADWANLLKDVSHYTIRWKWAFRWQVLVYKQAGREI